MPQIGFYHDDSLYLASAKSLASGHGYRILSLPDEPFQTKYPPLFPAVLAFAWKINPTFPSNLPLAALLTWCLFPVYLGLLWALFRDYGLSIAEQLVLVAAAALNPLAVLLSVSLMPELMFTSLLVASILLVGRAGIAGGMAGLAYLAKSASLPLLFAIPLCFVFRRQYRRAVAFAAMMLPAVVGWQVWVRAHQSPGRDLVTLYYTNYFGFRSYNISWSDLPLVIWRNLDAYLLSAGKLLMFDGALYESRHLERIVAIAAIAGVVRLARTTGKLQYPLTALVFSCMLLIWHYQPDPRFLFPLYPLLLAGLWTELKNVASALSLAWKKRAVADRMVAAGMGAILAGFACFVIAATAFGLFAFLPRFMQSHQDDLAGRLPAYDWIAKNTPAQAQVFAYDDPMLFLYADRRSAGMPIPPKFAYQEDPAGLNRMVDRIPDFAREQRLDYLLLTKADFYRDLQDAGAKRLMAAAKTDPRSHRVYGTPTVAIYALH